MVTPQVQTATSSHRTPVHSHLSPYERVLAIGLGVALALVAVLALMVPTGPVQAPADGSTVTVVQTVAHGKATPRSTSGSTPVGDDATSVE